MVELLIPWEACKLKRNSDLNAMGPSVHSWRPQPVLIKAGMPAHVFLDAIWPI